jgi:enamine deaminase RidA (YjgF/YER057c/UK114 family)
MADDASLPLTLGTQPVQRLSPSQWFSLCEDAHQVSRLLGGIGYGVATASLTTAPSSSSPLIANLNASVLSEKGPCIDAWFAPTNTQVTHGQEGNLWWRHDGNWLFGAIDIDIEAKNVKDATLSLMAERTYRAIFSALAQTGFPSILRLWNYMPCINADSNGLERYQQFNIGRQAAFLNAQRNILEGSPAACAIGTAEGTPFSVRFLASRTAPVALENPRQVSAYHYPVLFGPCSPTFSRAALIDAGSSGQKAMIISGTASIVGHDSVHLGDVQAQTRETLINLQSLIDSAKKYYATSTATSTAVAASLKLTNMVFTVYVRHANDVPLIQKTIFQILGENSHAAQNAVFVQADICRSELLVEIEGYLLIGSESSWTPS